MIKYTFSNGNFSSPIYVIIFNRLKSIRKTDYTQHKHITEYFETNHICQPNTELCHLIHTLKHLCLGQPETNKDEKEKYYFSVLTQRNHVIIMRQDKDSDARYIHN